MGQGMRILNELSRVRQSLPLQPPSKTHRQSDSWCIFLTKNENASRTRVFYTMVTCCPSTSLNKERSTALNEQRVLGINPGINHL